MNSSCLKTCADQADAAGFGGMDRVGGDNQFLGLGEADVMDHPVACARGRDCTELVFNQAESRVFGGQNYIATQCQFDATTIAKAIDCRDHGDFEGFQVIECLMRLAGVKPECRRFQFIAAEVGQIDTG